jgi:dihydropteroate synthase/2-amino-4-hydroxy-6-hydroxymethyldihydropteridine diphosphokinase
LGNPPQALSKVVRLLRETPNVRVETTSSLFSSLSSRDPEGDPGFANCVVRTQTSLSPERLLAECKRIEREMGRDLDRGPRHGPRSADVDILFYAPAVLRNHAALTVPHPRMLSRDFVLEPLLGVLHPDDVAAWRAPLTQALVGLPQRHNQGLLSTFGPACVPLGSACHLLGILNATPDSFSDGGKFSAPERAKMRAEALAKSGCAFIDVGGESTRPGARAVSAEEETARVVPVIAAVKQALPHVHVSIDTTKWQVAEAALQAGACCVNDVSMATLEMGKMLEVCARWDASLVLMHARGDPRTMDALTDYGGDVCHAVVQELKPRVDAALAAGIPRWRVMVDPGLGFAKTRAQNAKLLGSADALRAALGGGLGVVVGASRKRFLRSALAGEAPNAARVDRASAAAAAIASAGGADFVRAHDASGHEEALFVGQMVRGARSPGV